MNEIRGWNYNYLDCAENKTELEQFLNENDSTKLLEQATKILENNTDVISYGFVAGRALLLEDSGRAHYNPLHSIFGILRKRAREILSNPSFENPLNYPYIDYDIAAWVLGVTDVTTDIDLCLQFYQKYEAVESDIDIASCVDLTINQVGYYFSNLLDEVIIAYETYLKKGLDNSPEDNQDSIRPLLENSKKNTWLPYLSRVAKNPELNKNLDSNVLFDLLCSSKYSTIQYVVEVISSLLNDQGKEHVLYYFYQQATKRDIGFFKEYIDAYKTLNSIVLGEEPVNVLSYEQIELIIKLLNSKDFYKQIEEKIAVDLLKVTYKYINTCCSSGLYMYFILLITQYKGNSVEFQEFKDTVIKEVPTIVDELYEKELIFLNSKEFSEEFLENH